MRYVWFFFSCYFFFISWGLGTILLGINLVRTSTDSSEFKIPRSCYPMRGAWPSLKMLPELGRCGEFLKNSPDMGSLCVGTRWPGQRRRPRWDEVLLCLTTLPLQVEMQSPLSEVGDPSESMTSGSLALGSPRCPCTKECFWRGWCFLSFRFSTFSWSW